MRRCLGALGACLVVSACGSSSRLVPANRPHLVRLLTPSPTAFRFSARANRAFARHDVQELIRNVVLPRSARRVAVEPRSAPNWFRTELPAHFPGSVIARRIWVVAAPLKAVVRYLRTQARPRPRAVAGFPKSATRIGSRPFDHWEFRPVPGRSASRWVNVAMLALPSGATVVTAQAGDSWIHPPPASAEIPGTVQRIDITSRYGTAAPSVTLHVRNRDRVRSLVAWINGLGVTQGHFFCAGASFGEPVTTLTFRDARGKPVARGVVDSNGTSGCRPFSLTVNGRRTPPLTIGDLIPRVEHLLNADFSPPLARDVTSCLRRLGWKVQTTTAGLTVWKNGPSRTLTFHLTGTVTRTGPPSRAIHRCLRSSPHVVYLG